MTRRGFVRVLSLAGLFGLAGRAGAQQGRPAAVEALQKKYDDLGPMTMPEKVLLGITHTRIAGRDMLLSISAGWSSQSAAWGKKASMPTPSR